MRSVSKATRSPASMMRDEHSWNQGLVRGPEDSSRVSIHSPPRAMLPRCSSAQSSFSEMPGFSAACISAMAASQATIERRMAEDLVGRLDQPRVFHDRLAIADGDAEPGEFGDAFRVDVVDRDAAVAAAMLAHQIGDAGGPARDAPVRQLAAIEIYPRHRRAHFVDDAGMVGKVLAGEIVEQHDRTFGRDEAVARRVVRDPELHVGRSRSRSGC